MKTVRRIYFYLVALISLEVVIWGVIRLTRIVLDAETFGNTGGQVAVGLALTLVGLPIFVLHWLTAQKDAQRDEEERASRVRALFLYGASIGILIPVVQNVLAVINRLVVTAFGYESLRAVIGGGQTLPDNIAAIVINLGAFAYIARVLRSDWSANLPGSALAETRRLYRYAWVIYGLGMLVIGVQQVLSWLLILSDVIGSQGMKLANGLALTLVGAPLWAVTWLRVQKSLDQPAEKNSLLRLVVLYVITLVMALIVLFSGTSVLARLLALGLGYNSTLLGELTGRANQLALLITAGALWAYYSQFFRTMISGTQQDIRAAGLRRSYNYLLSAAGCLAMFGGLITFFLAFAERLAKPASYWTPELRNILALNLGQGLAFVAVGLIYSVARWRKMQAEAAREDELGGHARRSVVRKSYLYGFVFISVIGIMGFGGWLIYTLFYEVLSAHSANFLTQALRAGFCLMVAILWLVYYLRVMARDNRMAQRALEEKQSAFPTLLILDDDPLLETEMLAALHRFAPRLPVAVHHAASGAPDDIYSNARAVVLTAPLALQPPESLRLWLQQFEGEWVVLPLPKENRVWLGAVPRSLREMARDAARAIAQLAEGQPVRAPSGSNPLAVVAYICAGIIGLQLLFVLISLGVSFASR